MVSGKPYISTKRATIKAENALNVRQSVFVRGLKKLNAKKIKIKEFMIAKLQSPYSDVAECSIILPPFLEFLYAYEHSRFRLSHANDFRDFRGA